MEIWILHLLLSLIAASASCPSTCICTMVTVLCRDGELSAIPENISTQVQILDFSYNNFMTIPPNISKFTNLELLVLSHNRIDALDNTALQGLINLSELDLSHNNLTKWTDISSQFLLYTPSISSLDLSHNSLKGFPTLTSKSLKSLKLINCSITSIRNDALNALPNLLRLNLAGNKLTMLTVPLKSSSLRTLNLTNCSIEEVHVNAFGELKGLESLVLSQNANFKDFHGVSSARILDISDCNLESIPTSKLPNVIDLNLHGNHLRRIEEVNFRKMPKLQRITLSHNAIDDVHPDAFLGLRNVTIIDLSFNVITQLSSDLIRVNPNLKKLILSHNYLTELVPFVSKSLQQLDLSECEIGNFRKNSLVGMPGLTHLNLSRNVFTAVPNNFSSVALQDLDLGLCRITNLKNETFLHLPKLRSLNLAGNRLVEIKHSYLHGVTWIRLSDNTWRCDCLSKTFQELFAWLTRVNSDVYQVSCQSPEILEGKHWYQACGDIWFNRDTRKKQERAWVYVFVAMLVIFFIFIVAIYTKRSRKRKREVEEQRLRDQAEAFERLRRIQMRDEVEENRNAPDPREMERPPSYNEAIAMPPLMGSTTSIASRKSSKGGSASGNKRPKQRRKPRKPKTQATTSRQQRDDSENEPSSSADILESDV